jgi:hypothetical protein
MGGSSTRRVTPCSASSTAWSTRCAGGPGGADGHQRQPGAGRADRDPDRRAPGRCDRAGLPRLRRRREHRGATAVGRRSGRHLCLGGRLPAGPQQARHGVRGPWRAGAQEHRAPDPAVSRDHAGWPGGRPRPGAGAWRATRPAAAAGAWHQMDGRAPASVEPRSAPGRARTCWRRVQAFLPSGASSRLSVRCSSASGSAAR